MKDVHLFSLLTLFLGRKNETAAGQFLLVFLFCFDWGTESCLSFHTRETIRYITAKLILAHVLVIMLIQTYRIQPH